MSPDYVLKALSDKLHRDLDKVFEEEKLRVVERLERVDALESGENRLN